jgi:hypothetical protein
MHEAPLKGNDGNDFNEHMQFMVIGGSEKGRKNMLHRYD